jgi:3-dehydroquinate dehydratase/shikimate dehydrogenase
MTITNRSPEKAHRLADEIEGRVVDWMGRHVVASDILINATSVGMHPNVDDTPIHAGYFQPGMTVFDLVYNPESTLMVKDARARDCRVVTGVELFARQAALQFEMFTGKSPALDQIIQIVRRALSPVTSMPEDDQENTSDERVRADGR